MKNYKLTLAYDGTRYAGFEHQPDKVTIQGKLEEVLRRMLELEESPKVISAGRTDAGVHALGMVCNVQMETAMSEDAIKAYMNRYLPEDIAVKQISEVSERFHSRYNAKGKVYRYTYYVGESKPVFDRRTVVQLEEKPDVQRMQQAAFHLIGEHDFKAFCGNPRMKKSTVRELYSVDIKRSGSYLTLTYHGSGFLQYMVRILTGTLLEVGLGKRDPESVAELLVSGDRTQAGPTAPAKGLCLVKVEY